MLAYISGPVTGVKDAGEKFDAAQKYLEGVGYSVLNPHSIIRQWSKDTHRTLPETTDKIKGSREYDDAMAICLALMQAADIVIMLDGWEDSRGATIEHEVARANQMPIAEYADIVRKSRPDERAHICDTCRYLNKSLKACFGWASAGQNGCGNWRERL